MLSKIPVHLFAKHGSSMLFGLGGSQPDKTVDVCTEWLERHADQTRLAERWCKLESFLIHEHDLFQLDEDERADFIEAAPLDLISNRLDELYALNKKLIDRISRSHATTTPGLVSKLQVALALVHPDENKEAHRVIQSILHDIELT
ncbi:MAG: hypothetical protein ABJL57_02500 [Hyphomonas sp.]|uniref:hypothetical protein n=1 Tax=Hyphomonas sp. TaxID=87 RepID=UPI0032677EAD